MGTPTALNRNSCLLHGALQTVKSIGGAVPIIHSSAGCSAQQYWGGSSLSGCGGSGDTGGLAVSSSNVMERQVVFGGTSRLREQLKNTVKIKKGDFYAVLTGCATELVGDDVPAMTKELQEQFYKAIHISTPGFKGSLHQGYTAAVKSILLQLDGIGSGLLEEKNKKLVNLFGIIPEQDVFWRGNLAALKDALEGVGLEVNVLFGHGSNSEQWSRIPYAGLNISLSAHGLDICKWLEGQYAAPYIAVNGYPVGAVQTSALLREAGEILKIPDVILDEWSNRAQQKEARSIEGILDAYYKFQFQKRFAIVGDSGVIAGITRFLVDPLGLLPSKLIVTDPLQREQQATLIRDWKETPALHEANIIFESDGKSIADLLNDSDAELVFGSSIEEAAAVRKGIPFVPVSFPVSNRLVVNRAYAGIDGALTLLEELGSAIIRRSGG